MINKPQLRLVISRDVYRQFNHFLFHFTAHFILFIRHWAYAHALKNGRTHVTKTIALIYNILARDMRF